MTENWFRGNLHTHTSEPPASDVFTSARDVVAWYRDHGYDFVVITDHEHVTDVAPLDSSPEGMLVISGQEVTQGLLDPDHPHGVRQAHVNAIGSTRVVLPLGYPELPDDLDAVWRATPAGGREELFARRPDIAELFAGHPVGGVTMAEAYRRNLDAVRAAGGLPQINHPNLHWSVREGDLADLDGPYLMEIGNAFWAAGNLGGRDGDDVAPSTEALWDALLTRGASVWGTAGDDGHDYVNFDDPDAPTPGKAWVMVRAAAKTRDAILDALRTGRFYATTGVTLAEYDATPDAIRLRVAQRPGWDGARFPGLGRFRTRFIGGGGRLLAEVHGGEAEYRIRGDEGYVRAVVTDADGRTAWMQPELLENRP